LQKETRSLWANQSVIRVFLYLCLGLLLLGECSIAAASPIPVFVSIAPQAYFVKKIGGDRVQVEVLVRPGASPATYAPTPKQMARLASARVFFRIGVPFENSLLPKIHRNMPSLYIVDISRDIKRLFVQQDGGQKSNELDPHTWLDPMLVKQQAAVIKATLSAIDPVGRNLYEKNYLQFAEELDALDMRIRKKLKRVIGKTVFVYHPAYGYFCRAYGLHQKAVETGGKDPSPKHLARLIQEAKKEGVRVIFVQPQFSRKKAETVARAIGGTVVVFDPLAYNYCDNLDRVADQLAQMLR